MTKKKNIEQSNIDSTGIQSDIEAQKVYQAGTMNFYGSEALSNNKTEQALPKASASIQSDKPTRAVFSIEGSTSDPVQLAKVKALVKSLQKITGDASLEIEYIEEGSIRIVLKGSSKGIERLSELFNEGNLEELINIAVSINDFEILETGVAQKKKTDSNQLKSLMVSAIQKGEADLSGIDFSGADFSGVDLSGVDLSGADLSGVDLSEANLNRASLSFAIISGANLIGANLNEANLSFADLSLANLDKANLDKANLDKANLSLAKLNEANLSEGICTTAKLVGTQLNLANLSKANLNLANLNLANFIGANLSGANLSGTNLHRAILSGANLSEAILSGANLGEAILSEANLTGADLLGADLTGANLSEANVQGTILAATRGISDLAKADLRFRGAIFEDSPEERSEIFNPIKR